MSLLQNSNAIETSAGSYNINNSLRFRSAASAHLNRTFTNSNSSFTFSCWIKRGILSAGHTILSIDNSNMIQISSADQITLFSGNATAILTTTAVFRDPSAWYHLVIVRNGGQGGSTSVWTIYINNVSVGTVTGSGGTLLSGVNHLIGRRGTSADYFDGYMAEVNLIDGQALTPSSFGETNTTTGVWKPKQYTGTYGTNGFYLNYSDIALTSGSNAGLGKDFSGNGNYWTTTNISVTAGATYDAMTDVPTNTSATAANFCTLNPVFIQQGPTYIDTLANGNLTVTLADSDGHKGGTIAVSSGKWYWECVPTNSDLSFGILNVSNGGASVSISTRYGYRNTGVKQTGTSTLTGTAYGASFTTNDVIGVALDLDSGTITFYKNNVSQGVAYTGITGTYVAYYWQNGGAGQTSCVFNFGQRPFTYTPPTGYVAVNTYNLPDSTIVKGNSYMDATTYTGTGASLSVTNGANFRPDFVWIKGRSGATAHALYDAVRGTTIDIASDSDLAETTQVQGLTAFNSNGFTIGTLAKVNTNAATYVGWQWQAGSSTVTNTSGSISAQVRANTTTGFSVVTYTGTGANATVGHGLGVAPKMIIVKQRNGTPAWVVYHSSLLNTQYIVLDTNAAVVSSATTVWNSTSPTSSVFSLGTSTGVNASSGLYLAYCWSEIAGFSSFGSYTGNGNADGPFVYTGFRPKFVLIKASSIAANDWALYDTSRNTTNLSNSYLAPSDTIAETTGRGTLDILSNGFKLRNTNSSVNSSGATYIYMAFAENPFKNSLAR
jgi:hypothetical protein